MLMLLFVFKEDKLPPKKLEMFAKLNIIYY
jgi:hypothetical protein